MRYPKNQELWYICYQGDAPEGLPRRGSQQNTARRCTQKDSGKDLSVIIENGVIKIGISYKSLKGLPKGRAGEPESVGAGVLAPWSRSRSRLKIKPGA